MLLLVFFSGAEETGYYLREGVVTRVGSCGGGNGYFSGNYQCAVIANIGKNPQRLTIVGQAVVGQKVYQLCWQEKSDVFCEHYSYSWVPKRWERRLQK